MLLWLCSQLLLPSLTPLPTLPPPAPPFPNPPSPSFSPKAHPSAPTNPSLALPPDCRVVTLPLKPPAHALGTSSWSCNHFPPPTSPNSYHDSPPSNSPYPRLVSKPSWPQHPLPWSTLPSATPPPPPPSPAPQPSNSQSLLFFWMCAGCFGCICDMCANRVAKSLAKAMF